MTKITEVIWGRMAVEVDREKLEFKDCKVWPEGAAEWDWRITGTQHVPGIQVADIEDLVEKGVDVIILSRGMQLALRTCKETTEFLDSRKIAYQIEETSEAVKRYNELAGKGVRVAGVFHSTC